MHFIALHWPAPHRPVRSHQTTSRSQRLSPNGDTVLRGRRADVILDGSLVVLQLGSTGLAVQEAALLDGAPTLEADGTGDVDIAIAAAALAGGAHTGGCQVRDVLGQRVLRAHAAGIDGARLASLGERVVARVEVLALLEVLGEVVRLGGELAV